VLRAHRRVAQLSGSGGSGPSLFLERSGRAATSATADRSSVARGARCGGRHGYRLALGAVSGTPGVASSRSGALRPSRATRANGGAPGRAGPGATEDGHLCQGAAPSNDMTPSTEIYLTIDVEWACEEVLADTLRLLDERGVRATFFCTH